MAQESSWIEVAYSTIKVFTDDGKMDLGELNFLLGIALKDGKIDDEEKRVLRSLFDRITQDAVESKVWTRMQEVRKKYSI